MRQTKWHKLDNVGKFYASIANEQVPKVFRYSATLIDTIDKDLLQQALNITIELFPNFNSNLKRGLFWYYLEENNKDAEVVEEYLPICYKLYTDSDNFLYRVSYYKKRINFEVSHILSDGRGSAEFFKVLVSNYIKIKYSLKINVVVSSSYTSKIEDSFSKYYKNGKLSKSNRVKIYKYKSKKIINNTRFMEYHISSSSVLSLAHKYNATLTSFLVSVLIYSFKDELKESDMNKFIKIDIPVDLRKYFKSDSSKNFFGLTSVLYKFNSKEDALENIIESVNNQFKDNITMDKLSKRANMMVSFEKNLFCRIVPIPIKNVILKIINKFTSGMSTTCFSNIGIIKFKPQVEKYITDINVLTSTPNFQFTICSFKDDLSIGISSRFRYNNIIKNFCDYFTQNNITGYMNINEVEN